MGGRALSGGVLRAGARATLLTSLSPTADFGFARYLQSNMMAATLCGSPMYMVGGRPMALLPGAGVVVRGSSPCVQS